MKLIGANRSRAAAAKLSFLAIAVLAAIRPASAQSPDDEVRPDQSASQLAALWVALGSEHDDQAQSASAALAEAPADALALIERELAPLPADVAPRVRELVADLRAPRYSARERAQRQLAVFGALAVPELRRLRATNLTLEVKIRIDELLDRFPGEFAATDHDRRIVRAIPLLERIDDPRARELLAALAPARGWKLLDGRIPPLYVQLDSPDLAARAAAAVELTTFGDAALPVLPRLIKLMGDEGPTVRVGNTSRRVADHVAVGLPAVGAGAIEPLIAALRDPNPAIRKRVAKTLGVVRDERAMGPLIDAFDDDDRTVATAAVTALIRFGAPAVPPLLAKLESSSPLAARGFAATALGRLGDKEALAPIAALLHVDDPTIRRQAFTALRGFKDNAIDDLAAALRSTEPNLRGDTKLRHDILQVIGVTKDARAEASVIESLRDEQPELRVQAIYFLNNQNPALRDPAIVDTIFAAIDDDAPIVRSAAAQWVANAAQSQLGWKPQRVAQAMLPMLDDEDAQVRSTAAEALGAWHIVEAVDPLLPLLDDHASRPAAAAALGQLGDTRAIEPLRRWLRADSPPQLIRALGELRDRESVPALIALLRNDAKKHALQIHAAVDALGKIKDRRAVEPLIAALSSTSAIKRAAANALGEIRDPRAIGPLIETCRTARQVVEGNFAGDPFGGEFDPQRHIAAWPLVRMGAPAIEPLAQLLVDQSNSNSTRSIAAWALYNINSQGDFLDAEAMQPAVEPLAAALADPVSVVRYHAAMTLGALGDPRAADMLLEMIRTNAAGGTRTLVYANAPSYFGRMNSAAAVAPLLELLADSQPGVRAGAVRALTQIRDERAVEPLLPLLDDVTPLIRSETAHALGWLKAVVAVEPLTRVLRDPVPEVRSTAAESLGRIGDSRAADALASLGEGEEFNVRVAAALALVRLKDPRGADRFARCLADEDPGRREQAATAVAIAELADEAVAPPLIAALDDSSIRVRLYAASALGRIGSDAAVDALLAKLDDRENLRSILQGLAAAKTARGYDVLLTHLADDNEEYRAICADGLGASGIRDYIEPLVARLSDSAPKVRIAAINGLLALDAKSALPELTAALADEDPQVALYADRAIKRLTPRTP